MQMTVHGHLISVFAQIFYLNYDSFSRRKKKRCLHLVKQTIDAILEQKGLQRHRAAFLELGLQVCELKQIVRSTAVLCLLRTKSYDCRSSKLQIKSS
jgi:hypothetical protein